MANHIRHQIREALATQITGLTTTGSRVFQSRFYNIDSGELPAAIVYTKSENSEPATIGSNRVLDRTLSLVVEIYVSATANADDTADTICKEIETAIAADNTISGLAKDCYIESTELDLNGEGERPVIVGVLTFNVNYHTREQSPDSAL